jgi:hypothetical protein
MRCRLLGGGRLLRRVMQVGASSMSKASQPPELHDGPSRLPSTKSVTPKIPELSRSEQIDVLRDILLTADEGTERRIMHKVAEFVEKYPERAKLPVATSGELRARYVEFVEKTWEVKDYVSGQFDESEMSEMQPERAMCWADALCLTLQRYVAATETELHFGHDDGSTFTVEASNRWKAEYQEKQKGKMHGWLRQAAGGDYDHVENVPDGIEVEGEYENPKLALITRSASSKPDGMRLVPGEHESDMASSWSVSYDAIRNAMRSLGLDSSDWSYDARSEPHPGKGHGINACYGHEHIVLVVDADVPTHELRAELRRVAEAHVRATPTAGGEAHDLDKSKEAWCDPNVEIGTVEVFDLDDDDCPIDNVAGYVASYASIDADDGLLDRPTEYVAWAAAKDALNTRTMRRSEASVEMAKADLETIRGHSPNAHAVRDASVASDGSNNDSSSETDPDAGGVSYASDWGGKAGRVGSPVVHERLAERVGSFDADSDVSGVTATLQERGWDMSRATVEVSFGAGTRIREVADRLDNPTVPQVAGRMVGDVSLATVRRVLDGYTVDADLAEHIRAEFDADADAGAVADELQSRSMAATAGRVGSVLDSESYNYDSEQTTVPDESGWSLDAITRGAGTENAEREEVGGRSHIEMVEADTDRDEYEDMWLVPPSHIDDPADLVEDADRTVRWRYRNGVGGRGDVTGDYIRDHWGDVPPRDWWDYVQPHEAGTPNPFDSMPLTT